MRIVLIAFSLLIFIGVKAQTKEETMKWLATKITDYGEITFGPNDNIVCGYEGEWSYTEILDPNTSEFVTCEISFVGCGVEFRLDLRDISNAFSNEGGGWIRIYTKGSKIYYSREVEQRDGYIESKKISMSWNSEHDLYNRYRKAMYNLLEFNKTKETY